MIAFKQKSKLLVIILWVLTLIAFACKENKKQQSLERFAIDRLDDFCMVYDYPIDDSTVHKTKMEIYLVTGYEDTEAVKNALDSFVCSNIASDYDLYDSYFISFYKKSEITNFENLTKKPNDWDSYSLSNDQIYTYIWRDRTFMSSDKWEKGNVINYRYKIPCFKNPGYD